MAITLGDSTAPSQITQYIDALFATSLPKYRKKLTDNIGELNAAIHSIMAGDGYESYEGGTDIREPLLYALSPMDSYEGYDELSDTPTDGITQAVFEARQLATPISYSMKEAIQNRLNILNLVQTKIQQGEMGIQEGFATHFTQGSGAGAIETPKTSAVNGSTSISPLAKIVQVDPTTDEAVGNVNQSDHSWWQNKQYDMDGGTTESLFMQELNHLYNLCALGMGGPPNLILLDQVSYELFQTAYWTHYRKTSEGDSNFKFENSKFRNALLVMDDKIPDAENETLTYTSGSIYCLNTKFLKLRYIPERNFEMLQDENGKTFKKPLKGDSRLGHISWMGELTCNNRRKQGVGWGVPRVFS